MELDYRTEERAPREAVLEADGDRCTVTFPLTPAWLSVLAIAMGFALGGVHLTAAIYTMWSLRRFGFVPASWINVGIALFWAGPAAVWLRSYGRYGHLPRVWSVDLVARTLATRAERSGRWRTWPLDRIVSVEVKPQIALPPSTAGTQVIVTLRGRLIPFFLTFSRPNTEMAHQFAAYVTRGMDPDSHRDA